MSTIGKVQVEETETTEFNFEWRIDDFFSLFEKRRKVYFSPNFLIDGEYWLLSICPNGDSRNNSVGYLSVYFRRKSSGSPKSMTWTLSLKTVDGKKYCKGQCSYVFTGENGRGFSQFLKRSELIEKKSTLVPDGVLTVVCTRESCFKRITYDAESAKAIPEQDSTASPSTSKNYECIPSHPFEIPMNNTLRDLEKLFLEQEYCDVVIKVKGQEFKAHKIILVARSSVLAATFRNEMKEKATGTIEIKDCDPNCFSEFLHFLYCGKVDNLSRINVFGLFTIADKYDVQDLRSLCLEFMKKNLSLDTFCETLTLALQHTEKELIDSTVEFFGRNFQEIIITVDWQSFIVQNPIAANEILIKSLAPSKKRKY